MRIQLNFLNFTRFVFVLLALVAPARAQSRPFTTEVGYGSNTLVRSSYSPLSPAAQIDSAYRRILGRRPAVYETSMWLKDSKPGLQSRALISLLTSTEFLQRIGKNEPKFIDEIYRAVLRRIPLPNERNFQLTRISKQNVTREQFARDLVYSCEHAGILAQEAYSLLLGRDAPPNSSLVWCPGLQADLLSDLWLDLLSSDEYYIRNGRSARGLGIALYRDVLWRDAGSVELDHIVNLIVNRGVSRRQIAKVFLDSGELAAYFAFICAGQWVDTTGHIRADEALNACIATPSLSKLALPAGEYRVADGLTIGRSDFLLTTENLTGSKMVCERDFPACARFVASNGASKTQPLLQVLGDVSRVTVDHVIIDGNRDKRTDIAGLCAAGGGDGRNVLFLSGDDNSFQYSASVNTACKTALAVVGHPGEVYNPARRVRIVFNYLNNNGAGFDRVHGQWSDGITAGFADDLVLAYNEIVDSSDVAVIVGNSPRAKVMWNVIRQVNKYAFVGIMDTNWYTFEKIKNFGDSRGTTYYKNEVLCYEKCDVGIQGGLADMSTSPEQKYSLRVMGGWYEQNNVVCSKQGINIDLSGTPDYPTTLISNTVNRLGMSGLRHNTPIAFRSLPFSGHWGVRTTSAINISKPGDHSFVSTGIETPYLTDLPWS